MNAIAKYVKENKKEVFFVGLITIIAIILRSIALYCRSGIWFDELFSLYFIKQNNILDVITSLWREDVHMPAYFLLAHTFGNIFGKTVFVYKLFGTIISTLTIPLGFYVGKKLFNRETGYFFSILLAINVFFIYYSIEIRFYGLSVLLSILTTYFQLLFIKENKHSLGLILSTTLLIYTFNIGIIFVFFQFLVGLIYLILSKGNVKKYMNCGLLTIFFSIPAIIFLIRTSVLYNNTLFSFAKDVFYFDFSFVYNLAQAYFSNLFYTNLNNNPWKYNLATVFHIKYFIFGVIPILLSLFAILRGLKNKNIILAIVPSVLFLIFEISMASFDKMGVIARHTIIAFPAIILAVAYGFSCIKLKKLGQILFIIIATLQLSAIVCVKDSRLFTHFDFYENLKKDIDSLNLTKDDYIFTQEYDGIYKSFLDTDAKFLDINVDKFCFYGDKKQSEIILDKEISEKITRENKGEILKPYLTTEIPLKNLRKYLETNYLNNLKSGQRICLIITFPDETFINTNEIKAEQIEYGLYQLLENKINHEITNKVSEELSLERVINRPQGDYVILIFKK